MNDNKTCLSLKIESEIKNELNVETNLLKTIYNCYFIYKKSVLCMCALESVYNLYVDK